MKFVRRWDGMVFFFEDNEWCFVVCKNELLGVTSEKCIEDKKEKKYFLFIYFFNKCIDFNFCAIF
jgi:hypothetical protein